MLSRTAGSLFWLARYIERADGTSRMLGLGRRLDMVPGGVSQDDWRSVLRVTGCVGMVPAGQEVSEAQAVALLLLDPDVPTSVRSTISLARANGRAARTALSIEMWEALNDGWRRLDRLSTERAVQDLPGLIEWVRAFAARFRGAVATSMLRNEGHDFMTLGATIERADLTLRLLDVNYHILLPEADGLGSHRDEYRWNALLQTLSGLRAFHHVYRANIAPWHVTDFLLTNRVFPRSLAYSVGQTRYHLDRLSRAHGAINACHRTTEAFDDRLSGMEAGEIFQYGLHEFVAESIKEMGTIARQIGEAYHF
jgi:uncharacterized alpha-E superfamily protein